MKEGQPLEGKSVLKATEKVVTPVDKKKLEHKKRIRQYLNSLFYTIAQMVIVLYSLFSDDIRHFAAGIGTDKVFYGLTCVCIFFFLADILLWWYLYDKYLGSPMFWLDLISFLSMFFDLGWIYINFFNTADAKLQATYSWGMNLELVSVKYRNYIEVMRYVRLIRIQNFLKFEKYYYEIKADIKERKERKSVIKLKSKLEKEKPNLTQVQVTRLSLFPNKDQFYPNFDQEIYNDRIERKKGIEVSQSNAKINNAGRVLSNNNTKRVIIIILIMIITIPMFKYTTYSPPLLAQENALKAVYQMANYSGESNYFIDAWKTYLDTFNDTNRPLLSMVLWQKGASNNTNVPYMTYQASEFETENNIFQTWRPYELFVFNEPRNMTSIPVDSFFITAVFDDQKDQDLNAGLSLLRTFFVIVVLYIFMILFNRDANKLILNPLSEMMEKIVRIQQNPCKAAKEEFELMIKLKEAKNDYWKNRELKEREKYETSILLNTLVKSGELLALGFGEAGTEIIVGNLNKEGLSATSDGKKVFCIFGFCDIRKFGDANEVLREQTMQFVNKVALIVHFIVDKYAGWVNKNIGDCFLLVWKFEENEIEKVFVYDDAGEEKPDIQLKHFNEENNSITSRCELAVLSFIEIILAINKSASLDHEYNKHKKLTERIDHWKVNMGFGLHMGWAIEGAIGSDHKIDASYLSPNVNLSSRLEAATKQYGINLLISGQVYHNLSPDIRKLHRLVDIINAKGSKQAMELYTFDMNLGMIEKEDLITDKIKKKDFTNDDFNGYMIEYRKKLSQFHDMIFKEGVSTKALYFDHPSIREVRKIFTKPFYDKWDEGFKAYRSGDWKTAYNCFSTTQTMLKGYEDGPSKTLASYLKERNCTAPPDWKGVRSLTSK